MQFPPNANILLAIVQTLFLLREKPLRTVILKMKPVVSFQLYMKCHSCIIRSESHDAVTRS